MDYLTVHRATYNAVAEEYESRVESLTPVTEKAVSYFSSHLPKGGDVLDVGCGVGLAVKLLTRRGFSVTGVELSPKMAEYAKRRNPNSNILIGDFLTIDFDKSFDGIITLALIHLFPKEDAGKVLCRMWELLQPDGILYIGTTESSESKEGWEVKKDYSGKHKRFRRQWTEEELHNDLRKAGFDILEIYKLADPFGKVWVDFTAKKIASS